MKFLLDFFHQTVPKSRNEIPGYYRKALATSEWIYTGYFLLSLLLLSLASGKLEWIPALVSAAMVMVLWRLDSMGSRTNLLLFVIIAFVWVVWYVRGFGWGLGSQHILLPILALAFFNIYEPPVSKILYFAALILCRVILFAYSLNHLPVHALSETLSIGVQIINSFVPFFTLVIDYILFSTNIQDTERQLRLNNQELQQKAGTDPLTQLPNRRALLDEIQRFRKSYPSSAFSVAIADIDFFKRVNDTYGHSGGDYTLRTLSNLFKENAKDQYSVCRWGGEEFCFFMPEKNLDEAGMIMTDMNVAVSKLELHYEQFDFQITITIGVEENDFHSSLEEIMDSADRKLYMGKANGRDQVVV